MWVAGGKASTGISSRPPNCDNIGALGSSTMRDIIGRTLGHYRIVEKIGEGGMGEVYRANDERLDRDVAVKVLHESVAQDADRLVRFEREAKLLASLNHPNSTSRKPRRRLLAVHQTPQPSPPLLEPRVGSSRPCEMCSWRRQRDPGPGFQSHCARTKRTSWRPLTIPGGRPKSASRHCDSKPRPNVVIAWSRTKGNSYPSARTSPPSPTSRSGLSGFDS